MTPWDVLGLAPTDDARAIRRAYAARLKALDPDDRDGFVALRGALDAANEWWWDEGAVGEIAEPADGELDDDLPIVLMPASPGLPVPLAEDTPAWHPEAEAIAALVWADPPADGAARDVRDAELVARAERLLASPQLEEVATAQAVEDWLAWLIVEAMPRGDVLIEPGMRRFDWERQALDWNTDWSVRQVTQRRADRVWLERQPSRSVFGQGWTMLRDPARFTPRARDAGPVEATLREIGSRRPTLRADLDEDTVARWEALLDERDARPVARTRRRAREVGVGLRSRLLPTLEWLLTGWRGAILWGAFVICTIALWKGLFVVWGVIGALHLYAWLGRRR